MKSLIRVCSASPISIESGGKVRERMKKLVIFALLSVVSSIGSTKEETTAKLSCSFSKYEANIPAAVVSIKKIIQLYEDKSDLGVRLQTRPAEKIQIDQRTLQIFAYSDLKLFGSVDISKDPILILLNIQNNSTVVAEASATLVTIEGQELGVQVYSNGDQQGTYYRAICSLGKN